MITLISAKSGFAFGEKMQITQISATKHGGFATYFGEKSPTKKSLPAGRGKKISSRARNFLAV